MATKIYFYPNDSNKLLKNTVEFILFIKTVVSFIKYTLHYYLSE